MDVVAWISQAGGCGARGMGHGEVWGTESTTLRRMGEDVNRSMSREEGREQRREIGFEGNVWGGRMCCEGTG